MVAPLLEKIEMEVGAIRGGARRLPPTAPDCPPQVAPGSGMEFSLQQSPEHPAGDPEQQPRLVAPVARLVRATQQVADHRHARLGALRRIRAYRPALYSAFFRPGRRPGCRGKNAAHRWAWDAGPALHPRIFRHEAGFRLQIGIIRGEQVRKKVRFREQASDIIPQ